MHSMYFKMTTSDLKTMRSRKVVRRDNLRHKPKTYIDAQELIKLNNQINAIDAVLRSRSDQMALFE